MADHTFSVSRNAFNPKLLDILDKEWIEDTLPKDMMQVKEEKKKEDDEEELAPPESRLGRNTFSLSCRTAKSGELD